MSQMSEENLKKFESNIIHYFFFIFINSMLFFSLKGGCHDSDNFCVSGSLLIFYLYIYHM